MHGPARYLAPCVAALLLGSTTGPAGASAPDAKLVALRTAKRSVVLELYALESSLAYARAAVAENGRRQAALDTEHRRALVRAMVIRRSLATTQQRIATLLRRLYVEGSPEPVEVLLGTRSLPAVLEGIDGLERATQLNRRLATEAQRRQNAAVLYAEAAARLEITVARRVFKLTTRADRIEPLRDGSFAILDSKTGSTPTETQVRTGLSPQLTLEGAILRAGAFKDVEPGSLCQFAYVSLRGRDPAGDELAIEFKEGTPDQHADRALAKLKGIIERFEDVQTPYRALVSPMWKNRYGDYDHLARVAEWSAGGEDEEGVD